VRATETGSEEEGDTSTGFEELDELYPLSNPKRAVRPGGERGGESPAKENTPSEEQPEE
jgi:hypothetical protein